MCRNSFTQSGRQRWICRSKAGGGDVYCYSTTTPAHGVLGQSGKQQKIPEFKRTLSGKIYVITSAQNATPVHEGFLAALEAYCRAREAELVVIPIRYKNPTSRWTSSQMNAEVWADELAPYLYNQRKRLNKSLVLLGDIKTIPTAQKPLSGFEGITHGESGILGHAKLQLRTIATPHGSLPKIMTTTGSVTLKNYTDSKAGKKGEFHHVFGACVVELDGSRFHLRQINAASDGSFIDLDKEYLPTGEVRDAEPALGLVMGDTHVRFVDPAVVKATFGYGGIVERLKPKKLVWHDLLDGYSINPHDAHDPFIALAKRRAGMDNTANEVSEAIEFLRTHSLGHEAFVVASNHDDFLRRWLVNADWKKDPTNAEFYLQTAAQLAAAAVMGPGGASYPNPFKLWLDQYIDEFDQIKVLDPDESCMIGDIECGFHGHRGPNGAKATVDNLSKIGVRVISGHGHSPAIEGGHYRVGTSTRLKLSYTEGPSSWLNTHAVIYANGKRCLINIIDGKPWR